MELPTLLLDLYLQLRYEIMKKCRGLSLRWSCVSLSMVLVGRWSSWKSPCVEGAMLCISKSERMSDLVVHTDSCVCIERFISDSPPPCPKPFEDFSLAIPPFKVGT